MTRPTLVLLFLSLAAACTSAELQESPLSTDAQAIRSGEIDMSLDQQVFRVSGPGHAGTAAMVRYPRCLISAEHVWPFQLEQHSNGDKQDVESHDGLPGEDGPYDDLRIIWAKATEHPWGIEWEGDPLDIRQPDFQDLRQLVDGEPIEDFALDGPEVTVAGFGYSTLLGGAYQLRSGTMHVNGILTGSAQPTFHDGDAMALQADSGIMVCQGDSGGPMLDGGDVVGVISGSSQPDCSQAVDADGNHNWEVEFGFATALTDPHWDWVDETIERLCGKPLEVYISGQGQVSGERQGDDVRVFYGEDGITSGDVECDEDPSDGDGLDCSEMMHHGESISLTASAVDGWLFEGWEGEDCPCDESTDATCEFETDDMGEYSTFVSDDAAHCTAVFTCDEDSDGDGIPACEDCDDSDPSVTWMDEEVCDGIDNDCNGMVDEVGDLLVYLDEDEDGFGDPMTERQACELEPGWTEDSSDCDDSDPEIHPEAPERCNDADDDCDEEVDEDTEDGGPWYSDGDEDGYGDGSSASHACELPDGYVENHEDCDDNDPEVNPSQVEVCDGRDNDCDGAADNDTEGLCEDDGFEDDLLDGEEWIDDGWTDEGWVDEGGYWEDPYAYDPYAYDPYAYEDTSGYEDTSDYEEPSDYEGPDSYDEGSDFDSYCADTASYGDPACGYTSDYEDPGDYEAWEETDSYGDPGDYEDTTSEDSISYEEPVDSGEPYSEDPGCYDDPGDYEDGY